MRASRCAMVLAAALVLAACTQRPAETGDTEGPGAGSIVPTMTGNQEQDLATLERLKSEARSLARADGCSSAGQCRAAPLGAKPCGGPWEYLVYCSLTTDSAALHSRLELVRQYEDSLSRRYQRGSDCAFVTEPQVTLEGNSCRAATLSR